MKKIKMFMALFIAIFSCTSFVSCCEEEDDPINPFVGAWKQGNSLWEFKEDGTWIKKVNYYIPDTYTSNMTGTYTYNETSNTVCITYDSEVGSAYIYIIQYLSTDKIVIYNENNTFSLIRI